MDDWAARVPRPVRSRFEEYANADLEFRLGAPPDGLVTRLHLVAVDPAGIVVVCRSVEEWRFLPGGRREAGESLPEVAARELVEEAGCVLLGEPGEVFAHQHVIVAQPAAAPPALPAPGVRVGLRRRPRRGGGAPTNPADGESVVEVRVARRREAAAWLRVHDAEHADVVLLADAMGLLSA